MATFAVTYSDTELHLLSSGSGTYNRVRIELPAGVVQSGVILNSQVFGASVTEAMKAAKPSPISGDMVVVGLPDERAFMQVVEIPKGLRAADFDQALTYQWQTYLPIAQEEVYYSYAPVKMPKSAKPDPEAKQHFLVVAFRKDIVDSATTALKAIALEPKAFVPVSFGLSYLASVEKDRSTMVIRELPDHTLSILILQNGLTFFSAQIRTQIASEATVQQIDNVRQFYLKSNNGDEDGIDNILLMPGESTAQLQSLLAPLGLPVTVADSTALAGAKPEDKAELDQLLSEVGLIKNKKLPMIILPQTIKDELSYEHQENVLHLVPLVIIGLASLGLLFAISTYFQARSIRNSVTPADPTTRAAVMKEAQDLSPKVETINATISKLLAALPSRTSVGTSIGKVYALADPTPGVKITNMSYAGDTKALTISGVRNDHDEYSGFIDKLKAEPSLKDVSPSLSSLQGAGPVSFTITATPVTVAATGGAK